MYRPDAVRIVRFVMRAQELGFGLREAETLLGLAAGGPESCQVARELAEEKIVELDRRIVDLRAMRDSLERLTATWLPGLRPRRQSPRPAQTAPRSPC
jgi:DNA-binding transcriptional MerR regulator